jgi:hypothetical protein
LLRTRRSVVKVRKGVNRLSPANQSVLTLAQIYLKETDLSSSSLYTSSSLHK